VRKVARSIEAYGFRQPIVVDADGVIVAGHTRLEAAKQLGLERVPVHRATELDEDQARAYRIADNRTADDSGWDRDLLVTELRELDAAAVDMEPLGFDDQELARLLEALEEGETEADAVPEGDQVEKRCEPGDLWTLGRHRLLCGDSTSADDMARLLDGAKPALCITDPPYGVEYDPNWRADAAEKGTLDFAPTRVGDVKNDDRADWSEVWGIIPCDVIYQWTAPGVLSIGAGVALGGVGFEIRNQIIWQKPHFPISRGHYTYRHESCWYAVKKGSTAHWIGDKKQSTMWEVSLDKNVPGGHSTQKPVELFTRAIVNHDGDVLEPFTGSGTCVIACEQTGRTCYAMEIDPHYCDVILARWEAFTGKKAELTNREEA